MTIQPKSDADVWGSMGRIDDDLLDPNLPEEAVDAELRAVGIDPMSISGRVPGLESGARLARPAWQLRAEERRRELAARVSAKTGPGVLSRVEMLARIDELRGSASSDIMIRLAARKRQAEETTDDELSALLGEMEALRALEDDDPETR